MSKSLPTVAFDLRLRREFCTERWLRSLVNALLRRDDALRYLVVVNPESDDPTAVWDWLEVGEGQRHRVEVISFQKPVPVGSAAEQAWLPKALEAKGADLLHSHHMRLPVLSSIPVVASVLRAPEMPGQSFTGRMMDRLFKRQWRKRVRHVFAASREIAGVLESDWDISPEQLTVAMPGPEEMAGWVGQVRRGSCESILPQLRELPRYFLTVGAQRTASGHELLLKALKELAGLGFPEMAWVFVGPRGDGAESSDSLIEELGLGERVFHFQDLADKDLAYLYEHATALVQPSPKVAFSLPVLEAMSAACPILLDDNAGHRELVGTTDCCFESGKLPALLKKLSLVLLQPVFAESLAKQGVKMSRAFSTERAAERYAEVFKSQLANL